MLNYKIYSFSVFYICLIFSCIIVGFSFSQSSSNHQIKKAVTDQGGSPSQSSNHKVVDAVGQSSPVGTATSTNYTIASGFFGGGTVIPTAIGETDNLVIPSEFKLFQNYPNPFNPVTVISYQISVSCDVQLSIYNLRGQRVTTLISMNQKPGEYEVEWDASSVSSGIYLYRIKAGEFHQVKKMVLIK